MNELPQCKCRDRKMQDFVYVPGFSGTDGPEWAFLFSPPEMDPELTIVVYLDLTTRAVSRDDAAKEMQKSKLFTKDRLRYYEEHK